MLRFRKAKIAVIAALVGAALPFAAHAQQAILQGGTWTAGHGLVYAPTQSGVQPIVLDSGGTPGSGTVSSATAGQLPWYATTGTILTGNPNITISNGQLTLGVSGVTLGDLVLSGSNSGAVSIKPQTSAGTFNFNLPTSAGSANQPLISGGGGTTAMSWGGVSGSTTTFATTTGSLNSGHLAGFDGSGNVLDLGSKTGNTSTFATTSGALTAGHCLTVDGSNNVVDNGASCGGSGTVNVGSAGQFAYYASSTNAVSGSSVLSVSGSTVSASGALTASGGTDTLSPSNANVVLSPTGTGVVTISPATLGTMDNVTIGGTTKAAASFTTAAATGQISSGVAGSSIGSYTVSGNTSGTITIKPQAIAGTYNYNLPITVGSSGQPLLSAGGGASPMTWGSLAGNTSTFATTSGALTSGHAATFDASGNIIDGGALPTGSINSGTTGQLTYYAGSGTTVSGNANLTYSSGALTVGVAGAQAGSLLLTGSSTGTITLKGSGTTIGTYNWNFPTTAGSANQPLLSGGGSAAAMAWGSLSGNTTKFGTVTGSLTNGNCIAADASGNLIDNGTPCGSGGSGTVTSSTAGQVAYYASSTNAVAGNSSLTISGGTVTMGVTGTTAGALALSGSSTGTVSIKTGAAAAGTYNFNLPVTVGSAGQVLTSQGGGSTAMTWTTPGATWSGVQNTSFNASSNASYCVDTSGGAVTATLPASPSDGDTIQFTDCVGTFATNKMTAGRNGKKIMHLTADMDVTSINASLVLRYVSANTDWILQGY